MRSFGSWGGASSAGGIVGDGDDAGMVWISSSNFRFLSLLIGRWRMDFVWPIWFNGEDVLFWLGEVRR